MKSAGIILVLLLVIGCGKDKDKDSKAQPGGPAATASTPAAGTPSSVPAPGAPGTRAEVIASLCKTERDCDCKTEGYDPSKCEGILSSLDETLLKPFAACLAPVHAKGCASVCSIDEGKRCFEQATAQFYAAKQATVDQVLASVPEDDLIGRYCAKANACGCNLDAADKSCEDTFRRGREVSANLDAAEHDLLTCWVALDCQSMCTKVTSDQCVSMVQAALQQRGESIRAVNDMQKTIIGNMRGKTRVYSRDGQYLGTE